MSIYRAASEAN